MTSSLYSFTSASSFPAKLLGKAGVLKHRFPPFHIQLNLTNACQLRCSYCSCKDRDRALSMDMDTLKDATKRLVEHGARAVTITGGGEPLLHPRFDEFVNLLKSYELELGLVTNGIAMRSWPRELYAEFSWIRVSFDSERDELPDLYAGVPVAFSYVYVSGSQRSKPFISLVKQAEKGVISHLRIVSDIRSADDPSYRFLNREVSTHPNVIIQNRKRYTKGSSRCWIALVKPVVDVDGLFYPCCGSQYAIRDAPAEYANQLCLGDVQKYLLHHTIPQKPFDGSICDRCYYGEYNEVLEVFKILPSLQHTEFI